MRIDSFIKDLAAASTPENLIADSSGSLPQFKFARAVIIRCPSTNTSDLSVGSKDRQSSLIIKGTSLELPEINRAGQSGKYELAEIFVKAGTNGDDVEVILIDPSNCYNSIAVLNSSSSCKSKTSRIKAWTNLTL